MIRLDLCGAHTRLGSSLCEACPQGPLGCCVGPPDLGLSDVGRIVARGGREWILAEILAENLLPRPDGLAVRRVRRRDAPAAPRRPKCVYHRGEGCTIPPDRRSATCNYFLCADAYADGGEPRGHADARRARAVHGALAALYTRWDGDLSARRAEIWPEPVWDAAFLDWLGEQFETMSAAVSPGVEDDQWHCPVAVSHVRGEQS